MSESSDREAMIFAAALGVPRAQLGAYLDGISGGDSELRQRMEALILGHDAADGFMESIDGQDSLIKRGVAEAAGDRIGNYKLLQKIGEGGCGVVWMAEQDEPVRRRVAVKIIKLGMDTKEVIARFSAERQALALMDHPNIARVFEAASTAAGRPFFAMELVRGIPITKYCDEHSLSTVQRLELFIQVCHAVQHAHQKGVIHRDLKPTNILVTLHDTVPVPKVIDFGIAKATQGRLTDDTLFTAFEQFLGTPAYMSPEQAEMSGIDIDTRSDIYSLGVLLYELLTGRPPFDPKTLMRVGIDEIRRVIREVNPPKPSTNVSTRGDADRIQVAKLRSTDPSRLSGLLRGDLDWIVMKAMEKSRARRYETPTALADDISRHLRDEPVVACPPSGTYLLGKLIRRHRPAFAAILAVVLILLSSSLISLWQADRAKQAEGAAQLERSRAEAERRRAEDLLGFMLGDLRPRLEKLARLDVLDAVGDKAMAYFASREASGVDDGTLLSHARALIQIGQIRIAETRYGDALASFAQAYERTVALTTRLPQNGEVLFARALAECGNGTVYWKKGELAAATQWFSRYRETCETLVKIDPAQVEWASELGYALNNLGAVAIEQGNFDAARSAFQAEIASLGKLVAAKPGDFQFLSYLATAYSFLAGVAEKQGGLTEAKNAYAEQTIQLKKIVAADPKTIPPKYTLALTFGHLCDVSIATGDLTGAAQSLTEARRLVDEIVVHDPANRSWLGTSLRFRLTEAALARQRGDATGAARLLEEARVALENLSAAEPGERRFSFWLAWDWRLKAQLLARSDRTGAALAASRAVEIVEKLISEHRATDNDVAECALACVIAGEIAQAGGDEIAAQRSWQHANELLASRPSASRDWRLLDPAVRAAVRTGRTKDAQALIAQLDAMGYVPLDPWPPGIQSDRTR